MHHVLPYSDSCLYWCLAYIHKGSSDLRIYVAVTSPYQRDRGVTGWYQSLDSHILSTTSRQINGKDICNWNAWVVVIQFNYKYKVIHSLLIILPWILKFSHPFILQFLVILRPTRTWKGREIITVLVLLRVALMEEVLISDDFCKIWWKTNKDRRRSRTKDYWLHSRNRSQATCQISGNYSQQSFRAWRSPECIAMAGKHDRSSEGNSNPWREPSENDQDSVERYGQDVVVGGISETGKAHHLGPVLEGFLWEDSSL